MARLRSLLGSQTPKKTFAVPIPEALPIHIQPKGAQEAFLLLHGFSGYPGELAVLAQGIAQLGYTVHVPRLPGHGTCRQDFLLTQAEDWTRCAYDAFMDLRTGHKQVHIIGHSMGALLASSIAVSFDVQRLVLLAPAFELSIRHIGLARLIAPLIQTIPAHRPPSAYDLQVPARKALHPEYWSDVMLRPAAELERLRMQSRKSLPKLRAKTLVIVGNKDRTIPVHVVEYIRTTAKNLESFESQVLDDATHLFPMDENSQRTLSFIAAWMGK
jgi:carboxylesterase